MGNSSWQFIERYTFETEYFNPIENEFVFEIAVIE
jgi:hypothetical protein